MMGNKWMQGGIFFGIALGAIFGSLLSAIHILVPFGIGFVFCMLSMWWCAEAKGTDGWGGPWRGPRNGESE